MILRLYKKSLFSLKKKEGKKTGEQKQEGGLTILGNFPENSYLAGARSLNKGRGHRRGEGSLQYGCRGNTELRMAKTFISK